MARAALALCVLFAACATVVRDLPPDAAPEGEALLAGSSDFSSLRLRSAEGRTYVVRPEGRVFLVALPPGTYTVTAIGPYRPSYDTLTIEARAGRARYVGSFRAARDESGVLRVAVRDELDQVARALSARYGERRLEKALVRSSLEPLGNGDLVIAVHRPEPYYPYPYYGFGWYGYYYWYGHPALHPHHHHRHARSRTTRSRAR